jgi:hypothetical protein
VGGTHAPPYVRSLFVSLLDCAESTVCWFVVREKHYWMAADSADKSKRTGRVLFSASFASTLLSLISTSTEKCN